MLSILKITSVHNCLKQRGQVWDASNSGSFACYWDGNIIVLRASRESQVFMLQAHFCYVLEDLITVFPSNIFSVGITTMSEIQIIYGRTLTWHSRVCARQNPRAQGCDLPYWAYVSVTFAVGTQKPCHGLTTGRDLAQSCWMKWTAQVTNSHLTSARRVTGDSKTVTTLKMLESPVTLSQVQIYRSMPVRCGWSYSQITQLAWQITPLPQDSTGLLCMAPTRAARCGGREQAVGGNRWEPGLVAFHRWHGKAELNPSLKEGHVWEPQMSGFWAPTGICVFGCFHSWAVQRRQQWGTGCFFSPLLSADLFFSHPLQRALSGWLVAAASAKAG